VSALRLPTVDGCVPFEDEFEDDDVCTLPIMVPPDLSSEMLRLLSDVQHATASKIADGFRNYARRAQRPILIGTDAAEAYVRSNRWAR
jgi:hypothetical protein